MQPTNGLPVAGLVLGILADLLALIPGIGLALAVLPALLALIFGLVGVHLAKRRDYVGYAPAVVSVGCAAATVPLAFLLAGIASVLR